MKEMDERSSHLSPGSLDEIGLNNVFAQVRVQEKDGRVRMLGGGVTPSDIWCHFPSRGSGYRLAMEYKVALERSEQHHDELLARITALQVVTQYISVLPTSSVQQQKQVHFLIHPVYILTSI